MEIKPLFTRKQEEKKRRRNQIALGIVVILLLALSSAGFAIVNYSGRTTKYGKHKFVFQEGSWHTKVDGSIISTRFLPQQVKNISGSIRLGIDEITSRGVAYTVADADIGMAVEELTINLGSVRIQAACLQDRSCENTELPVKTCDDIVFVFERNNNTKVWQNNNCIFVAGNTTEELLRATDKVVFMLYSVLK